MIPSNYEISFILLQIECSIHTNKNLNEGIQIDISLEGKHLLKKVQMHKMIKLQFLV